MVGRGRGRAEPRGHERCDADATPCAAVGGRVETVGRADASEVKRVDEVVQRLEGLVAEGLHG